VTQGPRGTALQLPETPIGGSEETSAALVFQGYRPIFRCAVSNDLSNMTIVLER
jgi:hypothetical protein